MKQCLQRLYSCSQWGYTLLLQFYALQTVAPSVLPYDDDAPVLQYLAGKLVGVSLSGIEMSVGTVADEYSYNRGRCCVELSEA